MSGAEMLKGLGLQSFFFLEAGMVMGTILIMRRRKRIPGGCCQCTFVATWIDEIMWQIISWLLTAHHRWPLPRTCDGMRWRRIDKVDEVL